MRNKTRAELQLDYYRQLVDTCILKYQNISTGLIANVGKDDVDLIKLDHWSIFAPHSQYILNTSLGRETLSEVRSVKFDVPERMSSLRFHIVKDKEDSDVSHAWVRDNIYCIMSIWGLALAYRKISDTEDGKTKAYELEMAVVKTMRGLLCSMQMQTEKLERFKSTQNPRDALHAKYSSITGKAVVGDSQWGHLQIDATSLYLLALAQITATGIVIIYTLDEVAFIQNLVFYIEAAYRTPDYGIWERGDKTNHGLPELNASSIGLAKAALEAINELDLFGSRGGPASVIHVLPDEIHQCQAILYSMLPRESLSKMCCVCIQGVPDIWTCREETDAALLTVIGFPAFAVDDPLLIAKTYKTIMEKLEGAYGCKRFLRDGYKTAKEDSHRLYYEPWELMAFENIECQWPLFFTFLILDGLFNNKMEQVEKYKERLEEVMLVTEDGIPVVPELYAVPKELVDKEYERPHSQKRVASGRILHMWSQSLYILGQLIIDGFISPGELDPLNRRLVTETKPDVVVQVVILCEDTHIQEKMSAHGIELQTVKEAAPIHVLPGLTLSTIYKLLGRNKEAGLTGRSSSSEVGLLATSKLYMLSNIILAFTPDVVQGRQFYLGLDVEYLVDDFKTKIETLRCSWKGLGRPLIIYELTRNALDNYEHPPKFLLTTIKKLQAGYTSGTRVCLGKLSDFQHTSCIAKLNFLKDISLQTGKQEKDVIDQLMTQPTLRAYLPSFCAHSKERRVSKSMISLGIHGIVLRNLSIPVKPVDSQDFFTGVFQGRHRYSIVLPSESLDTIFDSSETDKKETFHYLKDAISTTHSDKVTPFLSPTQSLRHLLTYEDEENFYELVQQLRMSDNLQEQADIIHYLFITKGPHWATNINDVDDDDDAKVLVIDLLNELYEKAGRTKQWYLVRHTAGLLKKRVEDLALAATDLLVRQKQLTVGLPPDKETIITNPLPPDELAAIIFNACGTDYSTASLTQELLVYLAIYIRTEPRLFGDMLRLRVGLIIQVMATELSRSMHCSGDEASVNLMNLSPFDMKTLLYHMLSGKEFFIRNELDLGTQTVAETVRTRRRSPVDAVELFAAQNEDEMTNKITDHQGQWLRRRRLDGSMNRVPLGFYPQVWELLRRCRGIIIKGNTLSASLTREMTQQEFKFAYQVEKVLNNIPQPEYRQLTVEAMMVLTMLVENDTGRVNLNGVDIEVDRIISEANDIFIKDVKMPPDIVQRTMGAGGICLYFYDSAPSGTHGSMTYMARALANIISLPVKSNNTLDCCIS